LESWEELGRVGKVACGFEKRLRNEREWGEVFGVGFSIFLLFFLVVFSLSPMMEREGLSSFWAAWKRRKDKEISHHAPYTNFNRGLR
jgi:hypothetical protein